MLSKRIKIFAVLGFAFIAINKFTLSRFSPLPNLEMIIPTICVMGCFPLYCGRGKFWGSLTRYFGVVALVSVFLADLWVWGFRPIYAFTWSGFVICWFFAARRKLFMFGRLKHLLWHSVLTTAVAIIIFDVYTCFGWAFLTGARTLAGLAAVFLAQIPFTLYHLSSLTFVPPLVGLAKLLIRVRVPVPAAVPVAVKIRTPQERG